MSKQLVRFIEPSDASATLTHDSGPSFVGAIQTVAGRSAFVFGPLDALPNGQGATLSIARDGYHPRSDHGVLWLDRENPVTGSVMYDPDIITLDKAGTRPFVRSGRVSASGRAWTVGGDPWYPLTYSLLWGLGGFMKGGDERARVGVNAQWMADHGADAVRTLYTVDWARQPYGSNIRGTSSALAEYLDWMWGDYKLRVKVTAQGGSTRRVDEIGDEIVSAVSGREDTVLLLEAVNEQYSTRDDAIALARILARAGLLVGVGWGNAGPDEIRAITAEAAASVSIQHTERGDPASRRDRQCWDLHDYRGAADSGEPAGPASSVASEGDPFHLAFQRAGAIAMGAGSWCLHTGAMVYGVGYQGPTGYRHANVWEIPGIEGIAAAVRGVEAVIGYSGVENWAKTNNPIPLEVVSGSINKQYYAIGGRDVVGILTEPGLRLAFRENRRFAEWGLYHPVTGEHVGPDAGLPGYVVRGTLA